MIVRISVLLVILAVYLSTSRVDAGRSKLKIHVPQRIKTIHHYHKKHYHQYARGYGYGPLCHSKGYHKPSPNSVYHRGRGHSPSRYKKTRGRGRRRNYGAKRYGMYNYAGKYRNWTKYNARWKDRRGTASQHQPQYAQHPGPRQASRPRLRPRPRSPPPPPYHDADGHGGDHDDDDDDDDEYDDGQYHEDNVEGLYRHDERPKLKAQKSPTAPNRHASASEVGEKIHDSISEIIGLISKYSGHKDQDRTGLKEGYEAARIDGQKQSYDQRPSSSDSNNNKFHNGQTNGHNNNYNGNYNSNYDQRQNLQTGLQYHNGLRNSQQGNHDQRGNGNNYPVPTARPAFHQNRDLFGQAFQAFSHGGRTLPLAHQTDPIISYPTEPQQPGFGLNRFQGANRFQHGDHDIGFGQGLEVIPD